MNPKHGNYTTRNKSSNIDNDIKLMKNIILQKKKIKN